MRGLFAFCVSRPSDVTSCMSPTSRRSSLLSTTDAQYPIYFYLFPTFLVFHRLSKTEKDLRHGKMPPVSLIVLAFCQRALPGATERLPTSSSFSLSLSLSLSTILNEANLTSS